MLWSRHPQSQSACARCSRSGTRRLDRAGSPTPPGARVVQGKQVADVPAGPWSTTRPLPSSERQAVWQDAVARLARAPLADISRHEGASGPLDLAQSLQPGGRLYRVRPHGAQQHGRAAGSDAAVIRLKGNPLRLALTVDCNAVTAGSIRPKGRVWRWGGGAHLPARGAVPWHDDCLNFGTRRSRSDVQFRAGDRRIADACRALEAPIVGATCRSTTRPRGRDPPHAHHRHGRVLEDVKGRSPVVQEEGDLVFCSRLRGEPFGERYLRSGTAARLAARTRSISTREEAARPAARRAATAGLTSPRTDCAEGGCLRPPGMLHPPRRLRRRRDLALEAPDVSTSSCSARLRRASSSPLPAEARARLEQMANTASVPIRAGRSAATA